LFLPIQHFDEIYCIKTCHDVAEIYKRWKA